MGSFFIGVIMLVAGLWMFFDSISVTTYHGYISRYYGGSSAITMAPLMLGIFLLFFSNKSKMGWVVLGVGIVLVAADVISGLRFFMHMKLWKWAVILVFIAGGLGLIMRSYLPSKRRR